MIGPKMHRGSLRSRQLFYSLLSSLSLSGCCLHKPVSGLAGQWSLETNDQIVMSARFVNNGRHVTGIITRPQLFTEEADGTFDQIHGPTQSYKLTRVRRQGTRMILVFSDGNSGFDAYPAYVKTEPRRLTLPRCIPWGRSAMAL